MISKSKKINLIYIVSTNWSKKYFEKALEAYIIKNKIYVNNIKIVCISEDACKSTVDKELIIQDKFFFKLNRKLSSLLNPEISKKINLIIKDLNNESWTLVSDNELRNHEILFCAFLKLSKDIPLLVLDHGLKNSQDSKFYEYFSLKRILRNIFLIFFMLRNKKKINDFICLKYKRIYFHHKPPKLKINNFYKIGLLDLEREIDSYLLNKTKTYPIKITKPCVLILTSGAHRYNYHRFRYQSLLSYKNIIKSFDQDSFNFIIKIKPREDMKLIKSEMIKINKNIIIFDEKISLGNIVRNNNITFAFTLFQSITLASLNLCDIKTYGYLVNVPFNLQRSSWYKNFYKPEKISNYEVINKQKYLFIDKKKLLYFINNSS